MSEQLPERDRGREAMETQAPVDDDSVKRRRRICMYCLLLTLWLGIGIGLFVKMWQTRHDTNEEQGELRPWHFVNTEE